MYLLILYLPLMGSMISIFGAKFFGKNGSSIIIVCCMFVSLIISLLIFYEIVLNRHICIIKVGKWIDIGVLNIDWEFLYDSITSIMLLVILSISFCVHIYSIEYMYNDPHLSRFLSYLSLFTFFMIILVTAGNFVQMFVGWEGIGICSYLLINFWYTRIVANKAAMKAVIVNKIGDICLLLGIFLLFKIFGSLDFGLINGTAWIINKYIYINVWFDWICIDEITLIILLLVIGVSAKSAQIGLHTWLPDAMEGPTPVSALLHAATMVTAGVFLLLRISNILKYNEISLWMIIFIGGITAFTAATIGLFQSDIKKIIAYSTCSQLGYMVMSCGLNNYIGSLFHLMNHAFFKALLFLSAGAIIHSMLDQQDIRKMGLLVKHIPYSYIMILIGSLAIMGIPFLTGFYSKDFIIEYIYSSHNMLNIWLYGISILAAFLTSFYSIKILYLTFYNVQNIYVSVILKKNKIKIQESGIIIIIALSLLMVGSIFVGYIFKELFIGAGNKIWLNTLEVESYKESVKLLEMEFLPVYIKLIPFFFTLGAAGMGFIYFKNSVIIISQLTSNNIKNISYFLKMWNFFYKGYTFNENYNYYIYKCRNYGYNYFKNFDKGLIEWIGPKWVVKNINRFLNHMSKKNYGIINNYVFVMVLGCIILVIIIFFWHMIYFNIKLLLLFLIVILYDGLK